MAVTWKPIVYGPTTNNADYIPQWSGANTGLLKDGLSVVTSIGSPGLDTALPTDQAVREAITNMPTRHSGTSEGTGSSQEITHGFAAIPKRIELIPLEAGVIFSGYVAPTGGSETHFHVTATSGKDWAWVAESW